MRINIENKVEELSGLTPDTIPASVFDSQVPVILKGLISNWPLVKETGKKSKLQSYLLSFYQGMPTTCFMADKATKGRYFYDEQLNALNFSKQTVQLDELLSNHIENGQQHFYIGSVNIEQFLPGLSANNNLPSLTSHSPVTSIWIGNQSRIAAHQDLPKNLACCVSGRRTFTLFPPDQIANLYIGPLDFTPAGQAISMVDFHNPDFEKFPSFSKALAHAQLAELEPGDALFLPSMWWHHIEATETFNVLVNYWWQQHNLSAGAPMDALMHSLLNIKNLPQPQKQAWKTLFDYYVFNNQAGQDDHIPLTKRGILDSNTELSARKIRAMLLNKLNR